MKSKELRLLLSLGSSRKLLFGAIVGAVINTSIVIGNAFLIAAIIVGLIYEHPSVASHILALALLWGFRAIFTSQFERWASGEAATLKAALRSQVLSSPTSVTVIPSSQLTTLLIKGANSLDIYLARFLPQMCGAALTPFAVIIAISLLDLTSALIALFTLPLIPIFGALIGKYTSDAVTAKWKSLGTLSKYFEDSLRGIYTLAIYGRHKSQSARIEEMGERYTNETMKVLRISFLSALVLELAATISVALIAVSIGIRLVNSSMEFFPALAVLVLAPEVYFPLRNAASLFHASADGGAALSELSELTSKKVTITHGMKPISSIESIAWKPWSSPFGPGSVGSHALKSGEMLVLRGGSGLGKTTFLNSLLALNESSTSSINGVEVTEIESSSLFPQVGWIPQNPSLISGSLRDLFKLVKPDFSETDIGKVLEKVGLSPSTLPEGIDTAIGGLGEKSGHLSGGQKRRIAIARAIAMNPSLIIADEPTADLDPASAAEILQLLAEAAVNGAIVIAVLHAPDQFIPGAQEVSMVEA